MREQGERLAINLTPEEWETVRKAAARGNREVEDWVREAVLDRAEGGEWERARRLVDEFLEALNRVVEESENLADLSEEDRRMFLAAVNGVGRGYRMFMPKIMAELNDSAAKKDE
ncbi:hypothetical protein C8P63_12833 [Melghirimyces profundicolus]|uniref:Uncharacterized protein n=2 Tax=Melghirimyces profundicolus TaxID=1242148 RepID=A0A2T6BC67_9BACL|nr:hypothetical protein C8P63_12833 [Melghirimyces profundicolus]